jgi:hypothetical protein
VSKHYHPFVSGNPGEYSISIEVDKKKCREEFVRFGLGPLAPEAPPRLLRIEGNDGYLIQLQGAFAKIDQEGDSTYALFDRMNPTALDSIIRIVCSRLSLRSNGLLIHSAGIGVDGRGMVFVGPSESGKSTIAKLAPKSYTVLTDELSLVRKKKGQFWVFGTPFAGFRREFGANFGAPLYAVFLNQKDNTNYLEPVSLSLSLKEVVSNSLLFEADPNRMEDFMKIAEELVSAVPCYKFHFKPTVDLWEVIPDDKTQ